jgi:hypothetical protein
MRARFADGTIKHYFKDPILVLAFMVFMANIPPDGKENKPYVLLGGHGSLPTSRIRNYVEVPELTVVNLASLGFIVLYEKGPGTIQVTTESTCDESIFHSVPLSWEGPKLLSGPKLDPNEHMGVAYQPGEKFLDIDVDPFHMMVCGSFEGLEDDSG